MPAQQLNLALSLADDTHFDNFLAAAQTSRQQVLSTLKLQCKEQLSPSAGANILLWGATGSGLTHLLQAACHDAVACGQSIQYLPLEAMASYPAQDVLQGLAACQLICLDNIQAVAGIAEWEEALFHLFNQVMTAGGRLLISANAAPRALCFQLADLESRLAASTVFQLPQYSEAEKAAIVQFRAARLGLIMSEEALGFLMNRAPRDLHSLIDHLHRLDGFALQYQSKATIPLMKKAFGW
ncbi:MAG: DnaA regulatory inactivator Hda [Gammaproteobacteria bacterium]|nr:DnaA regulatory inactivator Hda [Gammaproteobacteria bacterium]MBQ0838893.1 DnaA regulatory inactivator Hda [Gammaproteobacteria bacterium]